jgi:hypothetical protein
MGRSSSNGSFGGMADRSSAFPPRRPFRCFPFEGASRDTRVPRVRTGGTDSGASPGRSGGGLVFLRSSGVTRAVGPEVSQPIRIFSPAGFFRVRQDSLRSMRKGSAAHCRPSLCWSRIHGSVSIRPLIPIFGPFFPTCEPPVGFHSGPGNQW